jgi:heavy metal translocating P-type ATPase
LKIVRRYPLVSVVLTGLAAGLVWWFPLHDPTTAHRLFLITLLLGGVPLVFKTIRGMFAGRFAADIVAALAIVTAVVFGEYFAGAVVVLMQSGGEALETYAMNRATASLEALLARAPKIAHRRRGEDLEDVPVDAVKPDDLLVVKPGDLVPVDGVVTAGTSAVDQSALTGEPIPIRAMPGVELMSGSVNLDGAVTLRALRPSAESQYQLILRLVEGARREKPPLVRIADRVAVWFTPVTLAMCGVAYLVTHDPASVLAVLVVATPCPLILAAPVAVIAAISRAAAAGIIVKTGAAIEQVGRARVVVFDKTGTLTLGRPLVQDVSPAKGYSADELLRLAAAVELLSAHHLGRAVAEAAPRRGLRIPPARDVQETPGLGVSGRVEGHGIDVGSAAYLASRGHPVPPADAHGDGDGGIRTRAFVAIDGRYAGCITFADRLRQQVPELMHRLGRLGVVNTVMLTGDRVESADAIAAQSGIRTVRANLLPTDKVTALARLKQQYGTVVMVGDGINDAPALASATVGIAMGEHGPAASAEAADIVLMVDDVSRVGDAIAVSQRMRRIILQSIGVGLGVSFALMVVASTGHIAPSVGALLQEALDAAVILNALRARTA